MQSDLCLGARENRRVRVSGLSEVTVKELHLAAFIKANGAQLQKFENKKFTFLSEKTEAEWRVLHSNSCCRRVDTELINLRQFLTK